MQNSPAPQPEGFATVVVPVQHLGRVYALLAELMAAELRASSSSDPGRPDAGGAFESWVTWQAARTEAGDEEVVVVDHSQGAWSRRELEALRAEVAGSPLETLLTVIASASPDGIVVDDLAMRAELEQPSVRAQLATLSKYSVRLFGERRWPMMVRQVTLDQGQTTVYRMPMRIADWWLKGSLGSPEMPPSSDRSAPVTTVRPTRRRSE